MMCLAQHSYMPQRFPYIHIYREIEIVGVWLYQAALRPTAPPPVSSYHHAALKVKYYSDVCSKCSNEHAGTSTNLSNLLQTRNTLVHYPYVRSCRYAESRRALKAAFWGLHVN